MSANQSATKNRGIPRISVDKNLQILLRGTDNNQVSTVSSGQKALYVISQDWKSCLGVGPGCMYLILLKVFILISFIFHFIWNAEYIFLFSIRTFFISHLIF
jgi:hypothetical protein